MAREDQADTATACCKVGRVIRIYGLDELENELDRRWTGEDGESASLRELQRFVNRNVLDAALVDAGVQPIEGEVENLRRVLNSPEVAENRRVEAQRRLENDGVDVDRLLDDFVSHQTIHNHLRTCRGVSAPDERTDDERLSGARSTIFGLQNRTEVVTEQTLSQLAGVGLVSPDSFDIVVDLQVICEECGRSHDIEAVLSNGGCSCQNGLDDP